MPAMDRPPSFQFYPRDFLADPAVQAMSHVALAGYVRLLCRAWDQDTPGVLPDDDAVLAVLSGLGSAWLKHRSSIAMAFRVSGGKWTQKRMVEERAAQLRRRQMASEAGSKGAAERKAREGLRKGGHSKATARPQPSQALASASASALINPAVPDSESDTRPADVPTGTAGCAQPETPGTAPPTAPPDRAASPGQPPLALVPPAGPAAVGALVGNVLAAMGAPPPRREYQPPADPVAEADRQIAAARAAGILPRETAP